jgi:endonuclease/exonuclease/phosphatase family metal-dependent hydrolase
MERGTWVEAGLGTLGLGLLAFGQGWARPTDGFEPGPRRPEVLRIVTWNVGGAEEGRPHGLQAADQPHVADVLAMLDPDVVLLQEVAGRSQLRELRDGLGLDWRLLRGDGDAHALVHRATERWPARDGTSAVRFSIEHAGRTVALAALHASAFDAEERNAQIGALADALLDVPADGWLLGGDLNLDLDPGKRGDLFTNDLHRDVETYGYLTERLVDAGVDGGPTAEPDRRLDYVLVSESLEVVAAGPWKGHRTGTMDHDPVVADLRWR